PFDTETRRRLIAVPVALCAVVLIALGLPRMISVLVSSDGEPVLRRLQEQQPVPLEELRTLIDAQESAAFWVSNGRVLTDLGLGALLLSENLPRGDPAAATALQQAIVALEEGVARAPANPYAWSRLAYARALAEGWSPRAVAALRLALITAPYEPRLLWSRLRMAFLAWPEMTIDDREVVFQQVRWAWQANRTELARLAVESKQEDLVRAALLRMPEDGVVFEELIKQKR
ncbi:MAG TPA: hypothetical protein VES39_05400, partial [Rhodospirillales bacterium]|nr:hypothetical protein [Rhodospirillales bacterium]